MIPVLRLFFMFFVLGSVLYVTGQENYAVKTFTTENGLPHNHVYSIAQDQNGFLWIATFDGLSRWNGYEFRNYYHNPADSTSVSYFQIDDVVIDSANNVWVCSPGFISRYNRATDNFIRYDDQTFFSHPELDEHGNLWCSTSQGILRWNEKAKLFEKMAVPTNPELEKLKKNYPITIRFDNLHHLWIFAYKPNSPMQIYKLSQRDFLGPCNYVGDFVLEYVYKLPADPALNLKPFVSTDGSIWLFTNYGTFKLDEKNRRFNLFPGFNPEIHLAGNSSQDLSRLSDYANLMTPKTISKDDINSPVVAENFLIDRQNIIWQSQLLKGGTAIGLTRKIPGNKGFKHYFLEFNPSSGLNSFFPVLKDQFGTIWGGATNINSFFLRDRHGSDRQLTPLDQESYQIGKRPRSFLEDSTGIWIGYFGGVLLRYDFQSKAFRPHLLKKTGPNDLSLPQSLVHLKKDGDQLLIVGFKDIFRYQVASGEFVVLKNFGNDSNFNMYCITRDVDANGWWVGASLSRLIHFTNDFEEMTVYPIGKKTMFNIEDIVEGENNDLWISTLGGGIAHFDKTTGNSKIYTTADGLSNNTCYGMLKDKHGNLWVSTNHGISRFNPETEQFRIFGPEDGLKIDEFNSDNTYLASDGEMFFAGMGGVVSFYPDSIADDQKAEAQPLVIEDFKVSGVNRFFSKPVYECDTVWLDKGDDNFQLNFACLDFRNAEKIRYRYRLIGGTPTFFETDYRHRYLNYSNLNSGNYHLEIEATNAQGNWVSKRGLWIIIPPFIYETWWFQLLMTGLVVLLLIHFLYSYNHRIRTKAKEQQDELRLESLRSQMNPHFIFNSLNSINYFISQNDRLSANRYIADFSRLIRSILGNMSSDYITLSKELDSIRDYLRLEHLRFGDKFDYSIDVLESVNSEEFLISPGLVQPFIENAIWHGVRGLEGRKGIVNIKFQQEREGALICVVTDDGIGRKQSEKCKSYLPGKTSRGINIVFERLKIINNLLKTNFQVKIIDLYHDQEETGTVVIIDIPLKNIQKK